VRMLLDSFDITTATGNHICMVYRHLGLRISDFQALIPGGKACDDSTPPRGAGCQPMLEHRAKIESRANVGRFSFTANPVSRKPAV
jgi:hypothetical protein